MAGESGRGDESTSEVTEGMAQAAEEQLRARANFQEFADKSNAEKAEADEVGEASRQ